MKCKYDYRLSTVFLTPSALPSRPDYTDSNIQKVLTETINRNMHQYIEDFEKENVGENEELEINSHNICFIDDTILISFLFQKKAV